MYSRRAHRNSHHGCRQCKEKRVKCDETQPRCLRCKSKGRDCTYTHLLSAHDPFAAQQQQQQQQQQRHHAPVPPLQQRLVCRANTLHASSTASPAQLEHSSVIFHHYMHVVTTVSPAHVQSEQLWRWDCAVRSFAASHAFLYHAALTYAALHRADLHRQAGSAPDEAARHVALAARHQTLSLAGFAPAVAAMLRREDSTADVDADPVLTCSSLILACAFVFPPAPGQHPLDQARQVIRLFQGTQALYARTWTASPGSGSSSISAYVRARVEAGESLGDGASTPAAEASLAAVEERARAATPPDDDVLLALARLRLLVRRLAARPGLHTIALHWPADLPPAFVDALARREHLALVVLAHWAACLARMRHLWWVSRWGAGVVRAVVDEVCGSDAVAGGAAAAADGGAETAAGRGGAAAGEWRRCLEWPARALGGEADAVCWHR
ncbi:hypothetical protein GTA08_BOTSDO04266 [Neofusicoccum parvum]|uniref:Uncharacterized protein n=1 Tax=Neofusicoccum parvum TaxID=310453 RepID=A0ACB5SEV1_9PEZI|nr:hypothetical protein GTA08_BOTSDO04266 [Neofusicoccum parvum]